MTPIEIEAALRAAVRCLRKTASGGAVFTDGNQMGIYEVSLNHIERLASQVCLLADIKRSETPTVSRALACYIDDIEQSLKRAEYRGDIAAQKGALRRATALVERLAK